MIVVNDEGLYSLQALLEEWKVWADSHSSNGYKYDIQRGVELAHNQSSKKKCLSHSSKTRDYRMAVPEALNRQRTKVLEENPEYVLTYDLQKDWQITNGEIVNKLQQNKHRLKPVKLDNRFWAIKKDKVNELKSLFRRFKAESCKGVF